MPKRKRTKKNDELDYLKRKIRKLKRKIRDRSEIASSYSASIPDEDFEPQETEFPVLRPDDWDFPDDASVYDTLNQEIDQPVCTEDQYSRPVEAQPGAQSISSNAIPSHAITAIPGTSAATASAVPGTSADAVAGTSSAPAELAENDALNDDVIDLDDDVLQILGDDPSSATNYGKDIRTELATRFVHGATEGITKENRKDLINKYLIPANCAQINAPKLNPEIKAAISDNFVKRDKGIESKQKEMASAISCLGEIITLFLNSKDKNNDLLQKLIDLSRILCDLQYADSVTRRNFILFSLKKDLKDHLVNTKIDTSLFGENLPETLKTAKAVMKSGGHLKMPAPKQTTSQYKRVKSNVTRPLNRRGPASRRQPPGPLPPPAPAPRARAPASRAPPPPPLPPPPARYYRQPYANPYQYQQPPQRRY